MNLTTADVCHQRLLSAVESGRGNIAEKAAGRTATTHCSRHSDSETLNGEGDNRHYDLSSARPQCMFAARARFRMTEQTRGEASREGRPDKGSSRWCALRCCGTVGCVILYKRCMAAGGDQLSHVLTGIVVVVMPCLLHDL